MLQVHLPGWSDERSEEASQLAMPHKMCTILHPSKQIQALAAPLTPLPSAPEIKTALLTIPTAGRSTDPAS